MVGWRSRVLRYGGKSSNGAPVGESAWIFAISSLISCWLVVTGPNAREVHRTPSTTASTEWKTASPHPVVQVVPFSVNDVGAELAPCTEPLNPSDTEPWGTISAV